jgi:hypothetical protein
MVIARHDGGEAVVFGQARLRARKVCRQEPNCEDTICDRRPATPQSDADIDSIIRFHLFPSLNPASDKKGRIAS